MVRAKAQGTGLKTNPAAGQELSVVSAIPAGISSKAHSTGSGITGGADAETDEEYLVRVLLGLRMPTDMGKQEILLPGLWMQVPKCRLPGDIKTLVYSVRYSSR
ncbi:MAG: baseplate J/gp47 family protein [Treponema sp.]|nr:baseplate J/gp47 family protein [Treponema sp.]